MISVPTYQNSLNNSKMGLYHDTGDSGGHCSVAISETFVGTWEIADLMACEDGRICKWPCAKRNPGALPEGLLKDLPWITSMGYWALKPLICPRWVLVEA